MSTRATTTQQPPRLDCPIRLTWTLRAVALASLLCFSIGLLIAPDRLWAGYLAACFLFTGLGVAALLFLAVIHLSHATWAVALRRVPEAMTQTLPVAAVLGVGLWFGIHSLYEWSHAAVVERDALLQHKSGWLDATFFALRMLVCFAVWIGFARLLVRRSRHQDQPGATVDRRANLTTSAMAMVALTVTFSVASFDWLMSLEPHWFSTIFALYRLAGAGLAAIAVVAILVVWLRRGSLRRVVSEAHLQDLGRVMLSLSVFWVYVWYCQYMLIWYAHIPEETAYFVRRSGSPWDTLSLASLVLCWAVPFLVLLSRRARQSESMLVRLSFMILVGQVIDLLWHVLPAVGHGAATPGLWELVPIGGALALFFLSTLRALGSAPLVPLRDPELPLSLSYHN